MSEREQSELTRTIIQPAMQRLPLDVQRMFEVRTVTNAVLSPDGKRVAFVVREWVPDLPRQRARIWCVETLEGSVPYPLTSGPRADTSPSWSPDSQQLAFASKGDGEGSQGKPQLYIVAAASGPARQVCTLAEGISDPYWSPNGTYIAFLSRTSADPADPAEPLLLQPGKGQHRRLWIVRPSSDTPEAVTPDGLSIWHYAWSPASHQFAVYYATGPTETDWYRGQIGLVAANGGNIQQLSQLTCQACGLTWSPDGQRIAYITGEWSDPDRGGGEIFTLSINDGTTRNLTPDISWSPTWCQWFPDGEYLLYCGWAGLSGRIAIVAEQSGTSTTLVEDFALGDSFWPHLSTSADLQTIVVTHSTQQPPDLWLASLATEDQSSSRLIWRQLTDINPIARETFALARTQRIRYASVDGWMIDGQVTWPLQREENALPPLVVNIHGGPSGVWQDAWEQYRCQLLAAAGYAVFCPNIRGSMGYGRTFADAVLGDMGGKDFQDVMYGIDYLIERGLVDGDRVGIMGWSYGGFMTSWAVTQTDRFKAAIIGAGICDFHSFHAQTNIRDWDMRYIGSGLQPASPLTSTELYRQRSSITFARRVTTPTLIVHGEKDSCVPVNQAYAFYRALEEQGIPVEAAIYPREDHGFVEYEHMRDYQKRILAWFKRHLA